MSATIRRRLTAALTAGMVPACMVASVIAILCGADLPHDLLILLMILITRWWALDLLARNPRRD
jgi:hypothetical protein